MKIAMKLAIATLIASVTPGAAQAAIMINSIAFDTYGGKSGTINYVPSGLSEYAGIGRLKLSGLDGSDPVSFLTYCIDIFHWLHNGPFTIEPVSTLLSDPTKRDQLNALLSHADPLVTDAETSAATQLAVWEIAFETGVSGYDLNSGNLNVVGGTSAGARTLANSYLTSVTSGTWTVDPNLSLKLLYAPDNQSQLFMTAVPEPTTWAMMIAGFGLVGGAMRYRRAKSVARFA